MRIEVDLTMDPWLAGVLLVLGLVALVFWVRWLGTWLGRTEGDDEPVDKSGRSDSS